MQNGEFVGIVLSMGDLEAEINLKFLIFRRVCLYCFFSNNEVCTFHSLLLATFDKFCFVSLKI